jgi:hypothetical protein
MRELKAHSRSKTQISGTMKRTIGALRRKAVEGREFSLKLRHGGNRDRFSRAGNARRGGGFPSGVCGHSDSVCGHGDFRKVTARVTRLQPIKEEPARAPEFGWR